MKTYAFIDTQNVYLSIQRLGWNIDWRRFRVYLKDKYGVEKAYLFIGFIEGNTRLYTELQDAGFVCIFKPTLRAKDGSIKGNVDTELVLHTMIQFNNFDKAVIVTSDGDFFCLVQYLYDSDKLLVTLAPGRKFCSSLLKRFSKSRIAFMDDLKEKICTK